MGTANAPGSAVWRIQKRDAAERVDIRITATEYAINTVESVAAYTQDFYPGKITDCRSPSIQNAVLHRWS